MEEKFDSPKADEKLEYDGLSLQILKKTQSLLKDDGHGEKTPELGETRIAEYIFDPPGTIGGVPTTFSEDPGGEEKSKLVINEQSPHSPLRYTKIMVSIFQEGRGELTWELIFQGHGVPRFGFVDGSLKVGGRIGSRTIPRKAMEEDLKDFLFILESPLYIIEPPKAH